MDLEKRARLILELMAHYPEGVTRERINSYLTASGEKPVDRRRLFKYFKYFEKAFDIDIVKERDHGVVFRYHFDDREYMPFGFSEQLMASALEDNFMKTFRNLGPRFQAPSIYFGGGYLRTIGEAMNRNWLLRVTYQKFSDVEPYDCILAPHVLKAYEGRWYLFALKWNMGDSFTDNPLGSEGIGLKTFALDRMLKVDVINVTFNLMKDFDATTFFKPYFGVCCDRDAKPVKIRIYASEGDAHYIRTLPLHHTQKEIKKNIFEVTLVPAKDFDIYMRRYPDTTWEVVTDKRGRKRQDEAKK